MRRTQILVILATLVLLVSLPAGLYAQDLDVPHKIFGTATLADGSVAPDGTAVAAFADDAEVATAEVADGIYSLDVTGLTPGTMLTFTLDGQATDETVAFETPGVTQLNLTATGAAPLPPVMEGAAASLALGRVGLDQILVDGAGMTLYLFTNDEHNGNASTCNSEGCVGAWPPLLTVGDAEAGSGVDGDVLGSFEREDGSTQVSYHGWPLYNFGADTAPGDVGGQGRGGIWWVVSPAGSMIPPAVVEVDPVDTDAIKDDLLTALLLEMALSSPSEGADGSDGQDGAAGATGATGATGSAGSAGSDGAAGAAGDSGSDGAAGGRGPEGDSGGGGLAIFALILAIVALVGAGGAFAMGRRS